jgi:uncharacterized membrane protein
VVSGRSSSFKTDGPRLERVITLTGAVVAIAMTLLVLPLVELSGEVTGDDLGGFLREHWDVLLSFVVSFLVIYVFWAAHGGAFRRLGDARAESSPLLRQLNMWWLLVIAFLPFPTAVVGREVNTTSAAVYIDTMLVLSTLTTAIILVVDRAVGPSPRVRWARLTTAVFALCMVLSLLDANLGLFALLLLAVVRLVEVRVLRVTSSDASRRVPTRH